MLRLLTVLLSDPTKEYFGLELADVAGLHTGTIYPQLERLEREGWLTSAWEDIDESKEGRRRRRYYRLTGEGARAAHEHVARATAQANRSRRTRASLGRA
jgi:DNA-binding PadR family transcriptional regulator